MNKGYYIAGVAIVIVVVVIALVHSRNNAANLSNTEQNADFGTSTDNSGDNGTVSGQNSPATTDTSAISPNDGGPVYCATDVKICPNGSIVGRVSPSCDFAACPTYSK